MSFFRGGAERGPFCARALLLSTTTRAGAQLAGRAPVLTPPQTPPPQTHPPNAHASDDDETTPERGHKVIPAWARSQNLIEELKRQQGVDPDTIFGGRSSTCDLVEIFRGVGEESVVWFVVVACGVWAALVVSSARCWLTHHHCALTVLPPQTPPPPSPKTQHAEALPLPPGGGAAPSRKREYHKRTSSGDWSRDKIGWQEEAVYKKAMGYA